MSLLKWLSGSKTKANRDRSTESTGSSYNPRTRLKSELTQSSLLPDSDPGK